MAEQPQQPADGDLAATLMLSQEHLERYASSYYGRHVFRKTNEQSGTIVGRTWSETEHAPHIRRLSPNEAQEQQEQNPHNRDLHWEIELASSQRIAVPTPAILYALKVHALRCHFHQIQEIQEGQGQLQAAIFLKEKNLIGLWEEQVRATGGNSALVEAIELQCNQRRFMVDHQQNEQVAGLVNVLLSSCESQKAQVNDTINFCECPLSLACRNGNFPLVRVLVELHGAHVVGEQGLQALICTASRSPKISGDSHEEMLRFLLKTGAPLFQNNEPSQALIHAIGKGVIHSAQILLSHPSVDVDFINPKTGACALGEAVLARNVAMLDLLREHGVSMVGQQGAMALKLPLEQLSKDPHSQQEHWLAVFDYLVRNGAKDHCATALVYASKTHQKKYVTTLLDCNVSRIDETDEHGECALSAACSSGDQEMVQLLLEKGATVTGQNGTQALVELCSWPYRMGLLNLLLDRGATDSESCALIIASQKGHTNIVNAIVERRVSQLDYINNAMDGHCALSAACAKGKMSVVKLLLKHNASAQGPQGGKALEVACRSKCQNIVRLLLHRNIGNGGLFA